MALTRAMLFGMLGTPAAIAIWWLILFLQPSVKLQFVDVAPANQTFGDGAQLVDSAVRPGVRDRPLSITLIAVLLLLTAPSMTWSLYQSQSASSAGFPAFFLGWVIKGPPAGVYYPFYMTANLALGIGLWWMKPWARLGAIAVYAFSALNVIAAALRPAAFLEIMQMVFVSRQLPGFEIPPSFVASLLHLS